MASIDLEEDIRPLSEFRANTAAFIRSLKSTRRPVLLTQRGQSAAVLMDVGEYQRLIDELDLIRELQAADREIDETGGIQHEVVRKELLKKYGA